MEPTTVKIKCDETETGYMIVNESDFIEGEHELFVESADEGPSRDEMKAFLASNEVSFPANIKQPALVELYNAEKAKVAE